MAIKSFLSEGGFSVGSVGSTPIDVIDASGNITASTLTLSGNLIVNGTTVTLNSTTTTLDDPIITLGGDTAPAVNDSKDRGVEFRWHNGTVAKVGFFGYDTSTGYLTFIPDAANASEVFSGTQGDIQAANFRGNLIGNATSATTATDSTKLPLAGGTLTGELLISYASGRQRITDGTNALGMGMWDGSNVRIEASGRPLYMVSYGGAISIGRSSGTNLVIDTSSVSWGSNALLHAGNYASYSTFSGAGTFIGNIAITTDASSGDYSLIAHKYAGVIKAFSGYSGSLAIYGGETGIATRIQAGGQYAITALTNGNVGIGTTSPTTLLHTRTLANTDNELRVDVLSGANKSILGLANNGTDYGQLYFDNATNAVILNQRYSSGYLGLGANSRTTDLVILASTGNVGIGTASPGARFEVRKTDGGNAFRFANYVDGGALGSWVGTYGAEFRTVTSGSVSHGMLINNNEANDARRTLDISDSNGVFATFTNGKVGIGTTAPLTALQVGSVSGGNIRVDSNGVARSYWGSEATPRWELGRDTLTSGGHLIFSLAGGSQQTVGSGIGIPTNSAIALYTSNGSALTERLRVDGLGNVGIGWTTPYSILTVGSNDSTAVITPGGNNTHLTLKTVGASGAIRFYATGGTTSNVAATESMRVDAGGNVGIGTTSPNHKLSVVGQIGGGTFSMTYADFRAGTADISGNDGVRLMNNGSTVLTVSSTSNVGIGTTAPSNTLSLYRTGSTPILQLYSDRSTGSGGSSQLMQNRILFGGVNNQGWSTADGAGIDFSTNYPTEGSTGKLNFWTYPSTTGSPNMTIWNGNVGIGTTSPTAALHVSKAVNADWLAKFVNTGTNPYGLYVDTSANAGGEYTFAAYTNAGTGLLLRNNGNFGVGTASPIQKLDVSGVTGGPLTSGTSADGSLRLSSGYDMVLDVGVNHAVSAWIQCRNKTGYGSNYNLALNPNGGNVGIGASGPTAKLEIAGWSTGQGLKLNYGNSSGTVEALNFIANGGANGVIGMQMVSAGVGDLWLGGSGGRSLTLYRDGNVGIGTVTPGALLEVAGKAIIGTGVNSGNSLTVIGNSGNGLKQKFQFQAASGQYNWFIGAATNAAQTLSIGASTATDGDTMATPIININQNGTVSIASTTAGAANAGALVVAGGISAGNTGAASYFGGSETYFQGSTGNTNLISTRAGTSNGATFQYKTGATLKWYHGLRGLVNDNFYIHNQSTDVSVLVLDVATNAATFAGDLSLVGNEKYLTLNSDNTVGSNGRARFRAVGSSSGSGYGGSFVLDTRTSSNNYVTALSIDSSQAATFAGAVTTGALTVSSANLILSAGYELRFGAGGADRIYQSATSGGTLVLDAGNVTRLTLNSTAATFAGAVTIGGNLTVNGTTTTVNSTTVTVDDPIITLGGDTTPTVDDNKDRGVEFKWHNGTIAKAGFFGFDDSTGYLTFIPDATNTSEVFSGTLGDIQATNFRGNLIGNAATATNVAYSGLTGTVPTWNQSTTGNTTGSHNGPVNDLSYNGNGLSGMGISSTWDARPGGVYDRYSLNWHTGISLSGYPAYGGVRLYSAGYPTQSNAVLRLEASSAVYTFGGLYSDGNLVLHVGNYNSYAPTLTGTGASGTWGINVTGTAASETLATVTARGNVATGNVMVPAGNGYGYSFWGDATNYKIMMSNAADAVYGPVTDYSLKLVMSSGAGRGITFGQAGVAPVAAINTTSGNMQIAGTFSALSKSFLIDHPTKPGMKLRHGSLEGPENGVYIRGKLKGNKIELPEYWTKLVDPESITVNLTAIGKSQDLYVESIIDNVVYIGGENANCFYTIFAERVDVAKLEVEEIQ